MYGKPIDMRSSSSSVGYSSSNRSDIFSDRDAINVTVEEQAVRQKVAVREQVERINLEVKKNRSIMTVEFSEGFLTPIDEDGLEEDVIMTMNSAVMSLPDYSRSGSSASLRPASSVGYIPSKPPRNLEPLQQTTPRSSRPSSARASPSGRKTVTSSTESIRQHVGSEHFRLAVQQCVSRLRSANTSPEDTWEALAKHIDGFMSSEEMAKVAFAIADEIDFVQQHTTNQPAPCEKRAVVCFALLDYVLAYFVKLAPAFVHCIEKLRGELCSSVFVNGQSIRWDTSLPLMEVGMVSGNTIETVCQRYSGGTWANMSDSLQRESAKDLRIKQLQLELENSERNLISSNRNSEDIWKHKFEDQMNEVVSRLSKLGGQEENINTELERQRARAKEAERRLNSAPSVEEIQSLKQQGFILNDMVRRLEDEVRRERERFMQAEGAWQRSLDSEKKKLREKEIEWDEQRDTERSKARSELENCRQQLVQDSKKERLRFDQQLSRSVEDLEHERKEKLKAFSELERQRNVMIKEREDLNGHIQREKDLRDELDRRVARLQDWESELKDERRKNIEELEEMRQRERKMQEQLIHFQRRNAELQREHTQDLFIQAEADRTKLDNMQKEMAQERRGLLERIAELEHRNGELEAKANELDRIRDEFISQKDEIHTLRSKASVLSEQLSGLVEVKDVAEHSLRDKLGQIAELELNIAEFKSEIKLLKEEANTYKGDLAVLQGSLHKVLRVLEPDPAVRKLRDELSGFLAKAPHVATLLQFMNCLAEKYSITSARKLRDFQGGPPTLPILLSALSVLAPAQVTPEMCVQLINQSDAAKTEAIIKGLHDMNIPVCLTDDELTHEPTEIQHIQTYCFLFERFCDPALSVAYRQLNPWGTVDSKDSPPTLAPTVWWTQRTDDVLKEYKEWRTLYAKCFWDASREIGARWRQLQPQIPKTAQDFLKLGDECKARGEMAKALECYNKSIELESKFTEAYFHRAQLRQVLNEFQHCVQDLTRVLQFDPRNSRAYKMRAEVVHFNLKNPSLSLEDYSKAISLGANDCETYTNRGEAYQDVSDFQYALDDYDKALEANPKSEDAKRKREGVLPLVLQQQKLKADKLILDALTRLPALKFEKNKAEFDSEENPVLDSVADVLKTLPLVRIRIIGTTTSQQKIPLAKKRAEACVNYITRRGIARTRVEGDGRLADQLATIFEPF